MTAALLAAALGLGLAATPHCAAMCAAPCAAASRGSAGGFQLGRLLGYSAAGALVAGSVSALAAASQAAPVLRPLWLLLQLGFLALGLWWLGTGRQPALLARDGPASAQPLHFRPRGSPALKSGALGLVWVLLPCGMLQGALLLAALAGDAADGAAVMAVYALASAPALVFGPWLGSRLRDGTGLRVAGLGLVAMSGWALTRGVWLQVAAWCAA